MAPFRMQHTVNQRVCFDRKQNIDNKKKKHKYRTQYRKIL